MLKESLGTRPLYAPWHFKLGDEGVWRLEDELRRLIDPETMLRHECIDRAVHYVGRRIPEMLGWQRKTLGPKGLAWFFQTRMPDPGRGTLVPVGNGDYVRRRSRKPLWTW